nr:MAG TPA: hypothetical protein [Bacteriophage sp.]
MTLYRLLQKKWEFLPLRLQVQLKEMAQAVN